MNGTKRLFFSVNLPVALLCACLCWAAPLCSVRRTGCQQAAALAGGSQSVHRQSRWRPLAFLAAEAKTEPPGRKDKGSVHQFHFHGCNRLCLAPAALSELAAWASLVWKHLMLMLWAAQARTGSVVRKYILTETSFICAEKGSEHLEWRNKFSHLHRAHPVAAVVFPEAGSEGLRVGKANPQPPIPKHAGRATGNPVGTYLWKSVCFWQETCALPLSGSCCSAEKASYMATRTAQAITKERSTVTSSPHSNKYI